MSSYSNGPYKLQQVPEKAYKYVTNINTNLSPTYTGTTLKTEAYNYSNNYSASTQNDKNIGYVLAENKQFQSTLNQAETKIPVYSFSKATEYADIKPQNITSKSNEPYISLADVAVQKKQATEVGGFKKKKGPVTEYVEIKAEKIDMKQAVVHPETSTTSSYTVGNNKMHMKRTESLDY